VRPERPDSGGLAAASRLLIYGGMNAISTASVSRRRRRIAVLLVAAAGIGIGGWYLAGRLRGDDSAPALTTAPAQRTDVIVQVTATGTLSPLVTVEVGSQVSGRVKELFADYNSEVKQGQVIARLDPELAQNAIAQAKARLRSAQASGARARALAAKARIDHERMEKLYASKLVAASEVDAALAERRSTAASADAAAADLTLARAAVEQAESNLDYTTITSPIDGVVISRNVSVGQTVAASLSAPVLFVIAQDLRKMEIHTAVAESDVGRIRAGLKVEFSADAYPERTFKGEVKQVRYEAQNVSNVVTYDAVVLADNDELMLRPGMTANVNFVIDSRRDVLAVPSKALRYRPAGAEVGPRQRGSRTLYVLRDGAPVAVKIKAGLTDGTNTEVVEGELAEGDVVITGDGSAPVPAGGGLPGGGNNQRRGPPRIL
jgi:HlyD family secretion protein